MRARSIFTLLTATVLSFASGTAIAADTVPNRSDNANIPQIDKEDFIDPDERVYFGWSGDTLPACDSGSAQRAVARQISRAVTSYYDGREIKNIEDIRETGFLIRQPSPVGKRYCNGIATLTDDTRHRIYYALVQYDGFLGLSWGVSACLDGLDKYRVYDGECRTVRPEQEIIPR